MENISDLVELQVVESAFERRIRTFAIVNKDDVLLDVEKFLENAAHLYKAELKHVLHDFNIIKTMSILAADFEKKFPKRMMMNYNRTKMMMKILMKCEWMKMLNMMKMIAHQ